MRTHLRVSSVCATWLVVFVFFPLLTFTLATIMLGFNDYNIC